jgi:hypothetical protein
MQFLLNSKHGFMKSMVCAERIFINYIIMNNNKIIYIIDHNIG